MYVGINNPRSIFDYILKLFDCNPPDTAWLAVDKSGEYFQIFIIDGYSNAISNPFYRYHYTFGDWRVLSMVHDMLTWDDYVLLAWGPNYPQDETEEFETIKSILFSDFDSDCDIVHKTTDPTSFKTLLRYAEMKECL